MTKGPAVGKGSRNYDHRELRRAFEAATNRLGELRLAASLSATETRRAVRAIEHLDEVLATHFRYEETESGSFAEVLASAPELTEAVDELRRQHRPLTDRMKEIVENARWAGVSTPAWQGVADAFDAFAREIQRHERAEDALVADTLFTDEGGSG